MPIVRTLCINLSISISISISINFSKPKGVRPVQPRLTALLLPRSNGKPEITTTAVVAPDDGHEDAQNILRCT
jgi:hypothetical protein